MYACVWWLIMLVCGLVWAAAYSQVPGNEHEVLCVVIAADSFLSFRKDTTKDSAWPTYIFTAA